MNEGGSGAAAPGSAARSAAKLSRNEQRVLASKIVAIGQVRAAPQL